MSGLFSDVASDAAVLSARGGGRHGADVEAILEEGNEPEASDAHVKSLWALCSPSTSLSISSGMV
jgi:hypothetical protein